MLEAKQCKENHPSKEHIAYFTMEVGISHRIPTYSGGLGILAGDLLKSYSDLCLPTIGVTLLNEKGYFYQKIDNEGNQIEENVNWHISEQLVKLPNEIEVKIEGRNIKVRAWKKIVRGITGFNLPVIFLDTNMEGNSEYDRKLTSKLYGGDRYYRLCQEIILGIGGVRMLNSLGYTNIKKYHMNEGHAALLTVELLKQTQDKSGNDESSFNVDYVKKKCVFTTHTPVAAGHDRFDQDLFRRATDNCVPDFILNKAIENNQVNMTLIALSMSNYINGVAKRHGEVTREMFPEYNIDSITNGIHTRTWVCKSIKDVFDKNIRGWNVDPYALRYALSIPKKELWNAHMLAKETLIEYINKKHNVGFHKARFTIGLARRFTGYKRPNLILQDINKLKEVAEKTGDIQLVFAGKAHILDTHGKDIIREVVQLSKRINAENGKLKIVFLEQYDMDLARMMVSGCDVWLNTPQRPFEASGTSGMKAALNGVPQFSTLDGWWVEGHFENVTGWSIGARPEDPDFVNNIDPDKDALDIYCKLENVIMPTFYNDNEKWVNIMRHCIALNGSFFNTYRMAQQYIANAYID